MGSVNLAIRGMSVNVEEKTLHSFSFGWIKSERKGYEVGRKIRDRWKRKTREIQKRIDIRDGVGKKESHKTEGSEK